MSWQLLLSAVLQRQAIKFPMISRSRALIIPMIRIIIKWNSLPSSVRSKNQEDLPVRYLLTISPMSRGNAARYWRCTRISQRAAAAGATESRIYLNIRNSITGITPNSSSHSRIFRFLTGSHVHCSAAIRMNSISLS